MIRQFADSLVSLLILMLIVSCDKDEFSGTTIHVDLNNIRYMRELYLIFVSLFILLLTGCESNNQVSTLKKIRINVDSLLSEEISVYDIVSDVDVVCLDDVVPLAYSVYNGSPWVDCSNDNLFVLDPQTFSIHVYDLNGKFIEKADLNGRGAGEYTMAQTLRYNKDKNLLEVLNPMGKIFRYTTGPIKYHSVVDYTDKCLLSTHYCLYDGNGYVLYSNREDDKLWLLQDNVDDLVSLGYRPPSYLRHYLSAQRPIFDWNGQQYIYRTYDGAIDIIDKDSCKLQRLYEWDFGKYQAQLEDIPKYDSASEYVDFIQSFSKRKVSPFIDMKIWNNKIFANVIFDGGKIYTLIHDLKNNESYLFDKTTEGMQLFHGNILNDRMYILVEAEYLSQFVNRQILDDASRIEYDKVINKDAIALVWYKTQFNHN